MRINLHIWDEVDGAYRLVQGTLEFDINDYIVDICNVRNAVIAVFIHSRYDKVLPKGA